MIQWKAMQYAYMLLMYLSDHRGGQGHMAGLPEYGMNIAYSGLAVVFKYTLYGWNTRTGLPLGESPTPPQFLVVRYKLNMINV